MCSVKSCKASVDIHLFLLSGCLEAQSDGLPVSQFKNVVVTYTDSKKCLCMQWPLTLPVDLFFLTLTSTGQTVWDVRTNHIVLTSFDKQHWSLRNPVFWLMKWWIKHYCNIPAVENVLSWLCPNKPVKAQTMKLSALGNEQKLYAGCCPCHQHYLNNDKSQAFLLISFEAPA